MSPSYEPSAVEEQAPFPGHPFGGLVRDDRTIFDEPFPAARPKSPSKASALAAAFDDAGGFDFHLGVYSRF
jgi:hypothetical protein